MDTVLALQGSASVARSTMPRMAYQLAPAFQDQPCIEAFGKPYRELSDRELEGVRTSLIKHYPTPLVIYALQVPFSTARGSAKTREIWLSQFERADDLAVAVVIKTRAAEQAAKKHAAEERKRKEYDERMAALTRPRQESTVDWGGIAKTIGALSALQMKVQRARKASHRAQDKDWANQGSCKTWFQLASQEHINALPGYIHGRTRYNQLVKLLKKSQWNWALYDLTSDILSEYISNQPGLLHNDYDSFSEAKDALWLIQKTALCR